MFCYNITNQLEFLYKLCNDEMCNYFLHNHYSIVRMIGNQTYVIVIFIIIINTV